MTDDRILAEDLLEVLGDEGFFRLVEAYAGVRLYVPGNPERSDLTPTLGLDVTARLAKGFAGGYIRVPLAREFRVLRYVKAGWSNRDIAQRLGLTESGVEKLIKRARKQKPVIRPDRQIPKQLKLF